MRIFVFCILQLALSSYLFAEEALQQVTIADPYIELHTGHGSGYPIFHVVERGDEVTIIRRHTDWFKLRTTKGLEGWAHRAQMEQTLTPGAEKVEFHDLGQTEFQERNWEVGVLGGEFDDAAVMAIYGGYAFNQKFSAELSLSQVIGTVSSSRFIKANLLIQPFPDWSVSPYFTLGTGIIDVKPRATLVQARDRSNQVSNVGIGIRTHITKRLAFRLEYNEYVIFSANNDKDQNEEIKEWKTGFAVFF
jgi:hypothetical protein